MTDRELLEAAAKALGGQARFDISPDKAPWLQGVLAGRPQPYPVRWNPLTDDGDALRLAVKLKIDVKHYDDHVVGWFDGGYIGTGRILYEGDPYAATRRAIVRAAAEIGGKT